MPGKELLDAMRQGDLSATRRLLLEGPVLLRPGESPAEAQTAFSAWKEPELPGQATGTPDVVRPADIL